MCRGFSLLELLTSLVIVGVLLSIGLSYSLVTQRTQQIKSAGEELLSFVETAKSIAQSRKTPMWIDVRSSTQVGDWSLHLADELDPESLILDGQRFPLVALHITYLDDRIVLLGERGKISNGSLTLMTDNDADEGLKLITSYGAGRVRLCSVSGAAYGYPAC